MIHLPFGSSSGPAETGPGFGALVVSLDFELHWGVRDRSPADGAYRENLRGARDVVVKLLRVFEEFEIAATWATVGILFAATREEFERCRPTERPVYRDSRLDPYAESVGSGESDDPLHFASSLVQRIRATPRQEVATHTFSHYYCLEPGQDRAAFQADLRSAVEIAAARGVQLRSIVFPRNQHNPAYDDLLLEAGLRCYRGNARGWMYRPASGEEESLSRRGARLLDSYLGFSGPGATRWRDIPQENGLSNVPASLFLRPSSPAAAALDSLRLTRIRRALRAAARSRRVFHLWWHPHNFGTRIDANMESLRRILECFVECSERYGMRSLSMAQAAALATSGEEWNEPPA